MLRLRVGAVCALVLIAGLSINDRVEAYNNYQKVFEKTYPEVKRNAKRLTCKLCHGKGNLKNLNPYGKAMAQHIEKKQKNREKILEALLRIEAEPVEAGSRVTFGERLQAGQLPAGTK